MPDVRARSSAATRCGRVALPAVLALVAGCGSHDEPPAKASACVQPWEHETSDLAPDPRFHFGCLENGLRWAWVPTTHSKSWVYMSLIVHAGSLAEEDDELGMAHFVEHMAFNGTEHHPPGTLVERFRSWGAELGPDLNAETDYRYTRYWFQLPAANDPDNFAFGLELLRDFAFGQSLLADEVEAEKPVIDAEQRERDTPDARAFRRLQAELYPDARLTHRQRIGQREVRARFTPESLRAFLEKWYRPDEVTVIVSGRFEGIDPDASIRAVFGNVPRGEGPPPVQPDTGATSRHLASASIFEPEMGLAFLSILAGKPQHAPPYDRKRVEHDLLLDAAHRMLERRLAERRSAPDAAFFGERVGARDGADTRPGDDVSLSCTPERWREALAVAEQELRRALEHGFTEAELATVRAERLRALDDAVQSAPDAGYWELENELTRAANERYVPISPATRRELSRPLLENTSAAEVTRAFREAWSQGERGVYLTGSVDLGADGGRVLAEALEASGSVPVEPWSAPELAPFAYASDAGVRGEIREQEQLELDDSSCDAVRFDNGVRVNVLRTPLKSGEICLAARLGEGRLSLAPEDAALGRFDGSYFIVGGLEAHDSDALRRLQAGRAGKLEFEVDDDSFAFTDRTSPADLLRELELLCAYLRAPGWRPEGYERIHQGFASGYERYAVDGQLALAAFHADVFAGDPRGGLPTSEQMQGVRLQDLRAWLAPFLADAPLEVALVGDLDEEAALDAAARTLGTLPARRAPRPYDERRRMPLPRSGLHERLEMDSASDSARVAILYPMLNSLVAKDRWLTEFLADVLADRLRVKVREELGASYSPGDTAESSPALLGASALFVRVRTAPADAERVLEACLALGDRLAQDGPTWDEVKRARATARKEAYYTLTRNERLAERLASAHRDPRALEELRTRKDFVSGITRDDLADFTHRIARKNASTCIVLPRAR